MLCVCERSGRGDRMKRLLSLIYVAPAISWGWRGGGVNSSLVSVAPTLSVTGYEQCLFVGTGLSRVLRWRRYGWTWSFLDMKTIWVDMVFFEKHRIFSIIHLVARIKLWYNIAGPDKASWKKVANTGINILVAYICKRPPNSLLLCFYSVLLLASPNRESHPIQSPSPIPTSTSKFSTTWQWINETSPYMSTLVLSKVYIVLNTCWSGCCSSQKSALDNWKQSTWDEQVSWNDESNWMCHLVACY